MKFLKFMLIFALAIMLVLTAVACGDDEESESSSQSESQSQESSSSSESESQSESESVSFEDDEDYDESSSTEGEEVDPSLWQSTASAEVKSKVEALVATKHKLTYNEDGSFRVMVLADAHITAWGSQTQVNDIKARIKSLVDRIDPNLIIFTGDNTIGSSDKDKLKQNIDALVSYIEQKEIPWCHVYGNHDHEGGMTQAEQHPIWQSYEYCISKDVADISGTGNCVFGVYKDNGQLGSLVWLLDSGAYLEGGGYDYIRDDQIQWYKDSSNLIKEYNNGEQVPGIMAFHIPLIENRTANSYKNNKEHVYEWTGEYNEMAHSSNEDTELLETIWELGDVKAIVTGHDHINDYMYNYKGVKLCASPNISNMSYTDEEVQGSRWFDLDASKMDDVPTKVEYVIKRIEYNQIPANTLLHNFNSGSVSPTVSGYGNEGLVGNTVIKISETGLGVAGSSALEISRGNIKGFEFALSISAGKIGTNKYIVMWCDFTKVEFAKASIGIVSTDGVEAPYRTDDNNGKTPKFYYLADGSNEWEELKHGDDGCFGTEQDGTVLGKKGYFAFPIADFRQGTKRVNENTAMLGLYFFASLPEGDTYLNQPFYIDNIMLVEDYTTATLPNE